MNPRAYLAARSLSGAAAVLLSFLVSCRAADFRSSSPYEPSPFEARLQRIEQATATVQHTAEEVPGLGTIGAIAGGVSTLLLATIAAAKKIRNGNANGSAA